MPVRAAIFADLESVARVLAAAFYDEEMNVYFHPHRDKYPQDYVRSWYQSVLEKWWGYDNIWIVSYETTQSGHDVSRDDRTHAHQRITGAAQWSRVGSKPGELSRLYGSWDPRHYLAPSVVLYHSVHRHIFPNRSVARPTPNDPRPLHMWEFEHALWPFVQRYYTEPSHRQKRWQLDLLGVHPTHQKQGFAGELIAWGLQRARDDGFPAVVTMAAGLEEFYSRKGFGILVGYATTDDVIVEEKDSSGEMVKRTIVNPLKQRGIGGGGIAWTRTEADG